jgi:hypothetical protein
MPQCDVSMYGLNSLSILFILSFCFYENVMILFSLYTGTDSIEGPEKILSGLLIDY